jgi:DNA-binding NarL/FixJ family response regulator
MAVETGIAGVFATKASRSASSRIVLLDDEILVTDALGLIIRDWRRDALVLPFQDEAAAWQELLQADPDLFITDIMRPGMAGCEMLRLLAQRAIEFPILVYSGYASEAQVRQWGGPDLNVTLLQKPSTAEELRRQLCKHIGPGDTGA